MKPLNIMIVVRKSFVISLFSTHHHNLIHTIYTLDACPMNYKAASVSSKKSPCTNLPIHCPICPPNSSGSPQTIWKDNAVNHFIIEHLSPDHPLSIPGKLVQMVIGFRTGNLRVQFSHTIPVPTSRGG